MNLKPACVQSACARALCLKCGAPASFLLRQKQFNWSVKWEGGRGCVGRLGGSQRSRRCVAHFAVFRCIHMSQNVTSHKFSERFLFRTELQFIIHAPPASSWPPLKIQFHVCARQRRSSSRIPSMDFQCPRMSFIMHSGAGGSCERRGRLRRSAEPRLLSSESPDSESLNQTVSEVRTKSQRLMNIGVARCLGFG